MKLIGETDGGNTPQWSDSKYSFVWSKSGLDDIKIPQGISAEMFSDASKLIKESIGYISDDIVVQGSRASGTANPIGTSSKGKPLYTLKVVVDEAGNVITAFPKK